MTRRVTGNGQPQGPRTPIGAMISLLLACGLALSLSSAQDATTREYSLMNEFEATLPAGINAITRELSLLNEYAATLPGGTDAISRAFSLLNEFAATRPAGSDAISREYSLLNRFSGSASGSTDAISREYSLLNEFAPTLPAGSDAISREYSLLNEFAATRPGGRDAISREFSLLNEFAATRPAGSDAISREYSLLNDSSQQDPDADGVRDDGDDSGTAGDNPCASGQRSGCDDNCPASFNPDQRDGDGDGLGDACDLPEIERVLPGDNATGVGVWANVRVFFTEPIDPATLDATNLRLLLAGNPVPAGLRVAGDGLSATLDPDDALLSSTTYQVDVGAGILDLDTLPNLVPPQVTSFETSASADNMRNLSDLRDRLDGEQVDEEFGFAVSRAGDVNEDGLQDWLVGAPGFDQGRGRALLYLGTTDIDDPAGLLRRQPDVVFLGVSPGDRMGVAVAGGEDLDGDGRPDIVIGAEQFDGVSASGPGRAYVVYFDPADYPNLDDPSVTDTVSITDVADVIFEGRADGDRAGLSVATAPDLDGDGRGECLVGAPGADRQLPGEPAVVDDRGEAYRISMTPDLAGVVDLGLVDDVAPVLGSTYVGSAAGDGLGNSVDLGDDVNCDGSPDLMLGAPFVDRPGAVDAGAGFLDVQPALRGISDADKVDRPAGRGMHFFGDLPGMQLGYDVALLGDHDGDACGEIAIGGPGSGLPGNTRPGAGEVLLIAGRDLDAYPADEVVADDVRQAATGLGTAFQGTNAGDELGFAVADGGDLNADGFADLLMGAPGFDADSGALYVAIGADFSIARGAVDVAEVGQSIPGAVFLGEAPGDRAGASADGVGDLDGDGLGDFVVGAPGSDAAFTNAGSVYVVVESPAPVPTGPPACTPADGCTVVDLDTGSQIVVLPGALNDEVVIGVDGIVDPLALPVGEPAGQALLGAAVFRPDGQTFSGNQAIKIATRACAESQVSLGETLPLFRLESGVWVDTGILATVTDDNPRFPGRLALDADVPVLRTYATFLPDADRDCIRDGSPSASGCDTPDFDNCPTDPNPSQRDLDGDGAGDACDTDLVLRVAQDGTGDYTSIQAAVDAAFEPGTRIEILPGTGAPYLENVVIDERRSVRLVGVDPAPGPGGPAPVVVDGGGGTTFEVLSTRGCAPVVFENLTIRGGVAVRAEVPTRSERVLFRDVTLVALDLDAWDHEVVGCDLDGTVTDGLELAGGATVQVSSTRLVDLFGTAMTLEGSASLENVLIGAPANGIVIETSGSLELRHSTVAGSPGAGVDNRATASGLTLAHAIVCGNAGGDIVGSVDCLGYEWSDICSVDCSSVNDNLFADPLLDGAYRPLDGSPVLDHGPDPALWTGAPCLDLDGSVRLADFDGDGIANVDPGAFERPDPDPVPGDVGGLRWADDATMVWDTVAGATEYHVYRGTLSALGYDTFGTCRDDLDVDRTDTELMALEDPLAGEGFFYLVTSGDPAAATRADREGSMGLATCVERSNSDTCVP